VSVDKSDEVIGKLGKVADSLETATIQLTGVVTQQQLDIARERISKCESEIQVARDQIESISKTIEEKLEGLGSSMNLSLEQHETLEKEFGGLRAMTLSAFAISIISLVAAVLSATGL